jgi:hypothetical protein
MAFALELDAPFRYTFYSYMQLYSGLLCVERGSWVISGSIHIPAVPVVILVPPSYIGPRISLVTSYKYPCWCNILKHNTATFFYILPNSSVTVAVTLRVNTDPGIFWTYLKRSFRASRLLFNLVKYFSKNRFRERWRTHRVCHTRFP